MLTIKFVGKLFDDRTIITQFDTLVLNLKHIKTKLSNSKIKLPKKELNFKSSDLIGLNLENRKTNTLNRYYLEFKQQ